MKKILISASIFLNVAFLIMACSKKDLQSPMEQNGNGTAVNLNEKPAAAYTDHFHGLTLNQVSQMISNYESHQSAVINSMMNIDDARSCWFSLNDLKSFVGHLEYEVQKNKVLNEEGIGVRFYYGAHSNPATLAGIPSNYAGLHNLVMIPTYKDATGINKDFDPYHVDQQTGLPLPLVLSKKVNMNTNAFTNNDLDGDGNEEIFSMDHGQLYPPYGTPPPPTEKND